MDQFIDGILGVGKVASGAGWNEATLGRGCWGGSGFDAGLQNALVDLIIAHPSKMAWSRDLIQ